MKRRDDILRIAALSGIESPVVALVVSEVCDAMTAAIAAGDGVRIDGLGQFHGKTISAQRISVRKKGGGREKKWFSMHQVPKFYVSVKL